jgi:hypothetical protein
MREGNTRTRWAWGVAAAFGLMALAGVGTAAHAGHKESWPTVVVKTGSTGYATGALGTARNSPHSDYIYCSLYALSNQGTVNAYCVASNPAGVYATCSAASEEQIRAIQAINGDSYIQFYWNANGKCTQVLVGNSSTYEPKLP